MPATATALDLDSHYILADEQVTRFREEGFIKLKKVLSPEVLRTTNRA